MSDAARLLCLLQHADSAFPSGAVSFSGGLEALRNDGLLADESALHGVLREIMVGRFLPFDRVLIAAAWDAAPAVDALARLDDSCDTATPPRELREGSRRAGAAMLSVHARLGTPGSHEFRARVTAGDAHAHLPVTTSRASEAPVSCKATCWSSTRWTSHLMCVPTWT